MATFADPWMIALLLSVLLAHALSFAVLGFVLFMFRRTQGRRAQLVGSLALAAEEDDAALHYVHGIARRQSWLVGTYVAATVLIAVITIPLFVFQPHIL